MHCVLSPKAKKIIGYIVLALVIVFMAGVVWGWNHLKDRHRGYVLDLALPDPYVKVPAKKFRAGAAAVRITPEIEDTWVDVDSNAKYEPPKGDHFIDKNKNGKFDAYWLAGFGNARAANGIHDDLWARAVVFGNQTLKTAVVVIDAIGFMMDDVIDVRQRVPKDWKIDHVIVVSTHDYEAPDLLGLWGEKSTKTGVNADYMAFVKKQILAVIDSARRKMVPAAIRMIEIPNVREGLVQDTRPPYVYDDNIYVLQFLDKQNYTPIATIVNWANQPETLGSKNLLITSDFPNYVRAGLEKGIVYHKKVVREGIGGVVIYMNGAVGGFMTPIGVKTPDPYLGKIFEKPSFEKARAIGYTLTEKVLDALQNRTWVFNENPDVHLWAKTVLLPLDNKVFRLKAFFGVLNRGMTGWMKFRSEVDLLVLGSAWILTIPGEIYPEIVNGGVDNPPEANYPIKPIEAPALREFMHGKVNLIWGLANDEIGTIIPKSEWNAHPPYLDHRKKPFDGEANSIGPNTAPILYKTIRKLLD